MIESWLRGNRFCSKFGVMRPLGNSLIKRGSNHDGLLTLPFDWIFNQWHQVLFGGGVIKGFHHGWRGVMCGIHSPRASGTAEPSGFASGFVFVWVPVMYISHITTTMTESCNKLITVATYGNGCMPSFILVAIVDTQSVPGDSQQCSELGHITLHRSFY